MIYAGDALPREIPDVNLPSFVLERARELGDRPALIDGPSGRSLTYGELEEAVRSFAAGLAARGFAQGDTFAICMPNAPEYAVAFHGVLAAGGRCTTANPLSTAAELSRQLADSRARMLLTAPAFLETAREAVLRAGDVELFVLGVPGRGGYAELLGHPGAAPAVSVDASRDIAAIPYSSGTTGAMKGVMLTHHNLVANLVQAEGMHGFSDEDVIIAVLPFFHIYGLSVIMNQGLLAGATLVTMPRFDLEGFLDLLERHRVTRALVVPPIALALAKHPAVADRDLSALEHIGCGAAPLGAEIAAEVQARIGCSVTQGYGMTEASPVTHLVPAFSTAGKSGSVGTPIPGTECRLVDPDTGGDARGGERGELWVRGPQVMLGYLGNPEATAAMLDGEGWLHTGDVAIVDEDGWFTIVDRVKELIKYKGFQVAPAELEALLITHPEIADCAVIGIPDEEAGELPKAFVVPVGDTLDPDEITRYVADQVAPHKRIRAVEIVDAIPKSPSGKILRRLLRERTPAL
ncbi:MAG TPA: 4-coumarate--CoA ligase family protein [Solirubrobacteraceae bacterium]|jgi:acyl-CoA synthetase (AMP-forming)/AMP-acid ligase II|nr:4-coumarate--CoA ligase family protein [Solirubrobacteraceae bacterium]